MDMIGKIRRLHSRKKKSVREIARATSLSRNTVRKYLRAEQVEEPKYRRAAGSTKLTSSSSRFSSRSSPRFKGSSASSTG